MQHVDTLPTIYGVDKNGKTKAWTARIYRDVLNDNATAEIEYGQLDGKKQTTKREYTEGKNIGKKNETTPMQQCLSETRRKWQDKMEKEGYSLVIPNSETQPTVATTNENAVKVFPMLAHTYEPLSSKNTKNGIVFPCYVQPKLDGLRCICYLVPNGSSSSGESKVVAQSRTGAYFETVEHICAELRPILLKTPGLILDGELYTAELPFEELAGLIKRKKSSDAADVQRIQLVKYHIYDIVVGGDYSERHARIVGAISKADKCHHLEVVHTQLIHTVGEFKQAFGEYVAAGYEGIMLRNVHGLYRQNYRSHDLQKYKEFVESEYPIVGFKEADGRDKGTVVWVCATAECRQFSVRPRGTQEQRRQWFQDAPQHVGKLLTVIYQELSELNVPRFPVGKAIRDGY